MVVIVRGDSTLPLEIPRNLLQPSMDAAVGMGYWLQWVYVAFQEKTRKYGTCVIFSPIIPESLCGTQIGKNRAHFSPFCPYLTKIMPNQPNSLDLTLLNVGVQTKFF